MNEIWKSVVGFEKNYEVSNFGNVKSLEISGYDKYGRLRLRKQKILKPVYDKQRYAKVRLWENGKAYDWRVHRLVAITFLPNPNNYEQINHIDGNPSNNLIDNIEWCNRKQNINHAFDNNLTSINKKTKLIRHDNGEEFCFRSYRKASDFLGKNRNYIHQCLKYKRDIRGIYGNLYIIGITEKGELMNDGYYVNKIGLYAYSNGFIQSVMKSKRTDSEKLKLIVEELSQLEERLQRLKEQQGETNA